MRVQFGTIITDLKGKSQGQIIQGGRYGSILRANTKPITRSTSINSQPRISLSAVSSTWKSLTPTERLDWGNLASTLTRYNAYGVPYVPTGFQIFCELNSNLLNVPTLNINTSAPIVPVFPNLNSFLFTSEATGPFVSIDWNYMSGDNNFQVLPCFYPLQTLGVSVPRGSSRFCGLYTSITTGSLDISTEFVKRFGSPAGGVYQVAIELKFIDINSGFAAPSMIFIQPFADP